MTDENSATCMMMITENSVIFTKKASENSSYSERGSVLTAQTIFIYLFMYIYYWLFV